MKALILAVFFFLVSCSSIKNKNKELEIIYIISNSKNVTVYNLTREWFTTEDILYLSKRNYEYGEFGGEFEFCSNDIFYCLAGGANLAIPKKLYGQKEWEYENRVCRSDKPLSEYGENIIECATNGRVIKIVYSAEKGVSSYVMLDDKKVNTLYCEKGLFAQ